VKEGADGELPIATEGRRRLLGMAVPCEEDVVAPAAVNDSLEGEAESSEKSSSIAKGSSSRRAWREGLMVGERWGEARGGRDGDGPGERREGDGRGELPLLVM